MNKTVVLVILGFSQLLWAAPPTSDAVTIPPPAETPAATTGTQAAGTPAVSSTPAAEPPPSPCRVQARNDHSQTGGTCPAGELMTGIEKVTPLTVHCAAIDVRCDAPTRFLAAEPPPVPSAVPAAPEKNVELLPPPPGDDAKN